MTIAGAPLRRDTISAMATILRLVSERWRPTKKRTEGSFATAAIQSTCAPATPARNCAAAASSFSALGL